MRSKYKILLVMAWLGLFFVFQTVSYAGEQSLNSLYYDVQLNEDGSMEVVETWDIEVSETNTLFKDFYLDESQYAEITNVKVKDLDTQQDFTQIDEEMYHVTKGCYYGLPISGGKFEIAWGVGLENASDKRRYEISYTVEDVVTVYEDCSELYWMFVGDDNAVPAEKVTGKITLPSAVQNMEQLRVWAHGPLNGQIDRISEDTVTFEVKGLKPNTMLEVRLAVEEPIFYASTKIMPTEKLESILEEETNWANEANLQREELKQKRKIIYVVAGVLFFVFVMKIVRYAKQLKKVRKEKYQVDIGKYFREIPREKEATPAEAAFLYYARKNHFGNHDSHVSAIFSATLLQLCLKGYMSFEKEGKKDVRITQLKKLSEASQLKESEKIVLEIIEKVSQGASVTIKEIEKYAKKNYDEFGTLMDELRNCCKTAHLKLGNYDSNMDKVAAKYNIKFLLFIVIMIALPIIMVGTLAELLSVIEIMVLAGVLMGECLVNSMLLGKIANAIPVLTEQGEVERQEWQGLGQYMEDFSLLKEREIPDLILWEKYLVYATAFGISDKVVDQLKVVYPEMEQINGDGYAYLYLMNSSYFGGNFVKDFNNGVDKVYTSYKSAYDAAHSASSSGSGFGGGFSGGGGGRRWWRPEWAEDK